MQNKIKRLIWVDALRGLLILLVVIGHSLQFGDYENRICWNIIYSFHMAAFFVVSGYVNYKESYQLLSLKKKVTQLLLPFVVWTVLTILLQGWDWHCLLNVILRPDRSYWFLYVLFVIVSIFTIVKSINSTLTLKCKKCSVDISDVLLAFVILALVGIMVISEFRWLGFQFISYYFGFYVLGSWLRKYNIHFTDTYLVVFCVCWLALSLFWRMHEIPKPLSGITFLPGSLLNYAYRYLTALVGSIFFLALAKRFFNNSANKIIQVLSYLGKVSLGLYVIHLFIGVPIYSYYRELLSSDTSIAFVILDSFTRISISLVLVYIIQHIPFVRLLLLGK